METSRLRCETRPEFYSKIGLCHYRARYYDQNAGRFLSEDPIEFSGGDTNLYAYVRNDSTSLNDPFGLNPDAGKCGKTPCFAQLKCRPTAPGSKMTHCFWYVQGSEGTQSLITGGSENGFLNVWTPPVQPGDPELLAPVALKTPLSPDVCDAVDKMLKLAKTWPQNKMPYNWQGPNSNSAANAIGSAGGFSPPAPPGSTGWPVPVPFPH
jgi:RHS repeat-associated protein